MTPAGWMDDLFPGDEKSTCDTHEESNQKSYKVNNIVAFWEDPVKLPLWPLAGSDQ
jgi:hypothetical protein